MRRRAVLRLPAGFLGASGAAGPARGFPQRDGRVMQDRTLLASPICRSTTRAGHPSFCPSVSRPSGSRAIVHLVPVRLIGGVARRALAAGSGWRVLAVFRRSFYCEDIEGALVCLGPPSLGAGPLNALTDVPESVDWEASGLRPGAPAACDGTILRVDGWLRFSLEGAREWRAERVRVARDRGEIAAGLDALAEEARRRRPAGLGSLIPALAGRHGLDRHGRLAQAGWRPISALTAWVVAALADPAGGAAPPAEVARLIGLGPGLTPSGDDALGGAMVALHALGCPDIARRLADRVLPLARERTTVISAAHLAAAADGEGAAALHATLAALTATRRRALGPGLAALAAIGHSSGWDALAGATAVLSACVGVREATTWT